MLDVSDPYSIDELVPCFQRVHLGVEELFAGLPPEVYAARPAPDAWSPAEHLRHLVLSVKPVARALSLPPLLLWARFGPTGRRSRRYVEVRETYRAVLAAGGKASGPYLPAPSAARDRAAETRDAELERWRRAGAELVKRMASWSEASLDRTRLPHPLLGKMTAREILLFTLYHDVHHAEAVRRIIPAAPLEPHPG